MDAPKYCDKETERTINDQNICLAGRSNLYDLKGYALRCNDFSVHVSLIAVLCEDTTLLFTPVSSVYSVILT